MHIWVCYTCSKEFRREPRNVPLGSRNNETATPRPMHHRSCTTGVRFFSSRLIYTFLRASSFFLHREKEKQRSTQVFARTDALLHRGKISRKCSVKIAREFSTPFGR